MVPLSHVKLEEDRTVMKFVQINFKRSYSGFLRLATKYLDFLSPRDAHVGTILRHFSVSSVRTPVNVSL